MNDVSSPAQEWRDGWKVVASGAIGFGSGASLFIMSAGLFVAPMQKEFGWSTTSVTILPLVYIAMAFSTLIVGMLVDRLGARRIALAGLLVLTSVLLAFSFVPPQKTVVYLLAVAVGVVGPMTSAPSFIKGVASRFHTSAGSAIGVTASGTSAVSFFALPLVSAAIQTYTWRGGYVALALVILLVAVPLVAVWFHEQPANSRHDVAAKFSSSMTFGLVIKQPKYWMLLLAIALASLPLGGFLTSLIPIVLERNFTIVTATSLGMAFAIGILIGRLGGGFLLDRYNGGRVAAFMLSAACAGAVLLSFATPSMPLAVTVVAVTFIGMGQGAEMDFIAYFSLRLFGMRAYSTTVSTVLVVTNLAIAAAGSGFALCKDVTGSYLLAVQIGGACYALAASLFFVGLSIQNVRETRTS